MKSNDTIQLYNETYFLSQVDGFSEYEEFSGIFDHLFERFQKNIKLMNLQTHHSYLEFGCGRGEICIYHALSGGVAVGVDYSNSAINIARKKAAKLNASVSFHETSFADFTLKENSYDRILASEFIEHISEDEGLAFLEIAHRALKPGGKLLIFTHPNTLQRRFGYPLIKIIKRIQGIKLPNKQEDENSEHYKMYHLNEQNYFTLKKSAEKTGFSNYKVNYDEDILDGKDFFLKKIIKIIILSTYLKHIFLRNLYLLAEK